jgi:hypothetical protein
MFSSKRSGRGCQAIVWLVLAFGLSAGCGTDNIGLVLDAQPPPPPTPDSGPRMPPPPPDGGPLDRPPGSVPDGGADVPPGSQCMSTGLQPNPRCTFGYHPLKRVTPEVVLVFDRSSAMLKTGSGTMQTRWVEMVAGLEDSLTKTHASLYWGLKLFPSMAPAPPCTVSDALDVNIALSNRDAVIMRVRGGMPAAGTDGSPLDLAIRKASLALDWPDQPGDELERPRYLILATDGVPSCPPGMPGEVAAVREVSRQQVMGMPTFVIGTATPANPQHRTLNDLATAGGEPRPGDQRYFPVLNKAEMLKALDEITGRLTSCVLMTDALTPAPGFVAMNIGNTRIPQDPARREGWNFGGAPLLRVVHVYGKACEELKANPLAPAELVFGCPDHPPPPPPACSTPTVP